jgi:hypothetical protein
MKQIIIYLMALTTIVIIGSGCKKQSNTNTDDTNVPGLPTATQIGANTFGCLVNGVAWVPEGSNGTNNLSIDYDAGINRGIFNIAASNTISAFQYSRIWIGIDDSINLLISPFDVVVNKTSIGFIKYSNNGNCIIRSFDNDVLSNGNITVQKHDKVARIISGKFEGFLSKIGCDTVKITNGRFDFKF